MLSYLNLVEEVMKKGSVKKARNAETLSCSGMQWKHDMRDGFPILTVREMRLSLAVTELRFFLNGYTDKTWLQERGNHFWDEFGITDLTGTVCATIERGKEHTNLGPIYGAQWNSFNHINQLDILMSQLACDPGSRRMVVSAWNPEDMDIMALPPCHYAFQVLCNGPYMDLIWIQRSCDLLVGLPWDICLYGLLLEVLCLEFGYIPRYLVGQLGDAHIYEQHISQAKQLLVRPTFKLPKLMVPMDLDYEKFKSSDELAKKITLDEYRCGEKMFIKVVP